MREEGRASPPSRCDIITVEDLAVGYGGTMVLDGINFSVVSDEILTILGASGCGKSTLLKALTGLVPAARGRIRVTGREITGENAEEALASVRQHIGVLFQSAALFENLTVAENVALPVKEFTDFPRELIDALVQLKLDLVSMGPYSQLMPAELSGGMKKRVGLARTTVLDPKILFCDEPAAGLDPVSAREVDELLLELNTFLGTTLVIVTHNLASIGNLASRCLMLDSHLKGIIASGTLDDLKQSDNPNVWGFFQRQIAGQPIEGNR